MTDEIYITAARLKGERAWTDGLIRRFLGPPDKLAPNPHYSNAGAPMRLYALSRVEAIEETEDFRREFEKSEARRRASRKAVATKIDNMIAAMEAAEITIVAGKTQDEIRRLAAATHGGNYMGDPGEFHFSNQVAVNCVRHNLTNYESLWRLCNRGETGEEAYRVLRERVDQVIQETYPEYFDN